MCAADGQFLTELLSLELVPPPSLVLSPARSLFLGFEPSVDPLARAKMLLLYRLA